VRMDEQDAKGVGLADDHVEVHLEGDLDLGARVSAIDTALASLSMSFCAVTVTISW